MTRAPLPTRRYLLGTLAACTVAGPARLQAQAEMEVTGPEDLSAILSAVIPGAVLRLAPGAYGSLVLRGGGGRTGAPITLMAANPAQPPLFAGMDIRDAAHLVLQGLHFDYTFTPGDPLWIQPFVILGGTGITVSGCQFDGDAARDGSAADAGYSNGQGLAVTGVQGLLVENCEIRRFHRGLVVALSTDVRVAGCHLHELRSDGMNFIQVGQVAVSGNHIHDFDVPPEGEDHPDMIQFWTEGTDTPSTDIVIRGNLLDSGRGRFTQSIFMRNELVDTGRAGQAMFYRNVLIEENLIANAHLHGITVGETQGLTIRQNTVLRNPRSEGSADNPSLWTPVINVSAAARDVTITGNIVASVNGHDSQAGWRVADNLLVQDRTRMEPNFYDAVFTGTVTEIGRLRYRKGGPADGTGIGAAWLRRD